MAKESINSDPHVLLKPGGTMEEGLATDLAPNQYRQASGYTNEGAIAKLPGKSLVNQYTDSVLQIAGFGGAALIQHGSTVVMYPDACAFNPQPEPPPVTGEYHLDLPNSNFARGQGIFSHVRIISLKLDTINDSGTHTHIHTWTEADLLIDPSNAGTGALLLPADYQNLTISDFITVPGRYGLTATFHDYDLGIDEAQLSMSYGVTSQLPSSTINTQTSPFAAINVLDGSETGTLRFTSFPATPD